MSDQGIFPAQGLQDNAFQKSERFFYMETCYRLRRSNFSQTFFDMQTRSLEHIYEYHSCA